MCEISIAYSVLSRFLVKNISINTKTHTNRQWKLQNKKVVMPIFLCLLSVLYHTLKPPPETPCACIKVNSQFTHCSSASQPTLYHNTYIGLMQLNCFSWNHQNSINNLHQHKYLFKNVKWLYFSYLQKFTLIVKLMYWKYFIFYKR